MGEKHEAHKKEKSILCRTDQWQRRGGGGGGGEEVERKKENLSCVVSSKGVNQRSNAVNERSNKNPNCR